LQDPREMHLVERQRGVESPVPNSPVLNSYIVVGDTEVDQSNYKG